MNHFKGRSIFSLPFLFASFFGAAMVASAFAYFNYKFSQYNFIDFSENIFYTKSEIFTPTKEEYIVIIFSSNMQDFKELEKYYKDRKILAIDLYQRRFPSTEKVTYISAGMNTLLKFIQRFNIYEVPSIFLIERVKKSNYKQMSMIKTL